MAITNAAASATTSVHPAPTTGPRSRPAYLAMSRCQANCAGQSWEAIGRDVRLVVCCDRGGALGCPTAVQQVLLIPNLDPGAPARGAWRGDLVPEQQYGGVVNSLGEAGNLSTRAPARPLRCVRQGCSLFAATARWWSASRS